MIRPPPLQLKIDNRFPQPLRTPVPPKSASFVSQLYKASWKNPIIALAGLNGLRYAFLCYNAFGDAIVDEQEGAHNLLSVSFALCVMYLFSFFIEIYGIIGVSLQRLALVRAYLYLTLLASLLVMSAGVVYGVAYFAFSDELVLECITLAIEGRAWQKSLFHARPWPSSMVPYPESLAAKQCVYAWVHHSWNHIAAVFIFNVIPSIIYYVLVYAYYRQTIDPSHHANLIDNRPHTAAVTSRRRGGAASSRDGYTRVDTQERDQEQGTGLTSARLLSARTPRRRQVAQQPYSMRSTNVSVASSSNQPGMIQSKRTFVSRGIKRNRVPPPLIESPEPIGLNLTPGPPTYTYHANADVNVNAQVRGRSRVYAAFAAPLASSEYDKFV
jgi:hypothetical protein